MTIKSKIGALPGLSSLPAAEQPAQQSASHEQAVIVNFPYGSQDLTRLHEMDQRNSASAIFAALSQDIDLLAEPEHGQLMLGLGKTMGEMYLELIYPIGLQHPVLDPVH